MRTRTGGIPWRLLTATAACLTAGVLPLALLGASAVLMREDVGVDRAQLGLSVAAWFCTTALVSLVAGRLAERIGGRRSIRVAASGSALTLAGMALVVDRWAGVLVLMVLGGAALALAVPASTLALSTVTRRRGLMFGLLQSAPPLATFLAGAAVPLIGITFGWRWGFGIAAVGAVLVAVLAPESAGAARAAGVQRVSVRMGPLVMVSLGAALGSASGISLGAFLVGSLVADGHSAAAAGVLLALGSMACVGARVLAGWLVDRHASRPLSLVAGMLVVAALGFLALAGGSSLPLAIVGSVVAFALGFGWSGLLFHAVVDLVPEAPGVATALVNAGATAGAAAGPALFGLIASGSFAAAWVGAAVVSVLGGLALLPQVMGWSGGGPSRRP